METSEILQWIGLCTAWVGYTAYSFSLQKRIKTSENNIKKLFLGYSASIDLIQAETKKREKHAEALNLLTNPEEIEKEMERGARVREMYDANRTTLPRENAGPPARVYNPKLRAKLPRSAYKKNQ